MSVHDVPILYDLNHILNDVLFLLGMTLTIIYSVFLIELIVIPHFYFVYVHLSTIFFNVKNCVYIDIGDIHL